MATESLMPMTKMEDERMEHAFVKAILSQLPDTTLESISSAFRSAGMSARQTKLGGALLCKHRGVARFQKGDYAGARVEYLRGVREILGSDIDLPVSDARGPYMKLSFTETIDMAALANNIALSYIREKDTISALDWLEDVDLIYHAQELAQEADGHEWRSLQMAVIEYYTLGIKARMRRAEIFDRLHNTAHAAVVLHDANTLAHPQGFKTVPEINALTNAYLTDLRRLTSIRHPDPSLAHLLHEVTDRTLQIRGSWQKQTIKKRLISRSGASVFVWNSRLYVFGGYYHGKKDVWLNDLHYLDLTQDTFEKWQPLPDLPRPSQWAFRAPFSSRHAPWNMIVWEDAAWLFVGVKQLAKFDLITETWSLVTTSISGTRWPYSEYCESFAMAVHKGVIYVFGGRDSKHSIGNNLFMALDLHTLQWKILSGTSEPQANKSNPGLRTHPQSWVDAASEKLYILYGSAERMFSHELKGQHDFSYPDMWTFHIPTSSWRQERLRGNVPSQRTEFSATYNPVLKKAFIFGGYLSFLPTLINDRESYMYAYFADTFMWSSETNIWSQVMTQGFPTHRAQSSLVTDPDTGRMYLFGGYSNTDFTGGGKTMTRCYGDVWQLCVDLPGGDLDKVNLEDEARLAALGVNKRCFNCGAIGRFNRCGGTCEGAVAFCAKECAIESWAEHKQRHKCRKKSSTG